MSKIEPGTLVRLIGDPMEMGAYRGERSHGGRIFARVQFRAGVRNIPLEQIEAVPTVTEEPLELLRDGRLSDPARLRQVLTHVKLTGRLADLIYSMEASDTEFHAHQFKPVLKMLSSPTGGLLIADEVGLGKTIEAGLIWTELTARYDFSRFLVVCPKVLCSKWAAELSGKFGLDPRILTAAELLEILQSPERLKRGFVAICSLQGLQPPRGWDEEESETYHRASSRLGRFLREHVGEEPLFDLLVIDEAHHLRNPETRRNLLGNLLRPVSHYKAFLSATPIQLRDRDLHSLLKLLDPETFRRPEDLRDILYANQPLIEAREALLHGRPLNEAKDLIDEAKRSPLLFTSQQLRVFSRELEDASEVLEEAERARLAGALEQINLLSSVVNRTRRRDVQEFRVVRQVFAHSEPMTPPEAEVYNELSDVVRMYAHENEINAGFLLATPQRMISSCLPAAVEHWRSRIADFEDEDLTDEDNGEQTASISPLVEKLAMRARFLPSPDELAENDSKFTRLLSVLDDFLKEHPDDKIVVFSTFRPTLRYLEKRLAAKNVPTLTIHGGVAERDEVLARFAEGREYRILLSSEVGSEGLDLQFCRALINYDLPWNPMRVEQRIGRVDRMGQASSSISVINLLNQHTIDDRIYRRLYERLDLCRRALGDFEAVLGDEITKLTGELLAGTLTPEEQEHVIAQTAMAIENRKRITEELEEEAAALMAHGDVVLQKIRAARELHRWIGAADLARYIAEAFNSLFPSSRIRDLGKDDLYEISLSGEARLSYADFLDSRRLPRGGLLERETGPVVVRLGRPIKKTQRRNIELIGQSHPFVRFLAESVGESDAAKLRPAVAVRLGKAKSATALPAGRYVIIANLWRFGGPFTTERIVYGGISLSNGDNLSPEQAEVLVNQALEHGQVWPSAASELDCAALAESCEEKLLEAMSERFFAETAIRQAEQNDRAEIQLQNLERRFEEEEKRLIETIEKQHRGGRVKGSVIAANEGRLKKLRERAERRRRAIEQSRKITSQQEALLALVVEVCP